MSGIDLLIGLVGLTVSTVIVAKIYNGLVSRRNEVGNAFAQIDVQLRRRHDLIPNLIEIAKKYMEHEKSTLQAVIAARSHAVQAIDTGKGGDMAERVKSAGQVNAAEAILSGTLGRLLAVSEAYPDLKADANMRQLSEELSSTENTIGFARQAYNDAVLDYNVMREKFPANLLAGFFSFNRIDELKSTENSAQREAVVVKF